MNNQDIIRPKRGSRLLLVSVIAQWFLFLSEDFSSFLSPVVFVTIFALSSTSLSSAGLVQLCSQCLCFSMLWTSLFRDRNTTWFLGAGELAKGPLPPLPTHPAPHVVSCQMSVQGTQPLHFKQNFILDLCVLRSTVGLKNSVFFHKCWSPDGIRWEWELLWRTLRLLFWIQELNAGLQLYHSVHKGFPCCWVRVTLKHLIGRKLRKKQWSLF